MRQLTELPHCAFIWKEGKHMNDSLRIDLSAYQSETLELEGKSVSFRAFRNLQYCRNPLDPIQKMNLFIPEAYFHDQGIGRYTKDNAPYFLPNTVGGYLPGPADEPGVDSHSGRPNTLFEALTHGLIAASAGVRGRTSGKASNEFFEGSKEHFTAEETGRMVGRAPAFIVDYKAAVRFLRHNADILPGRTDRIITNGTSAGGALSALAGATGNSSDYEPYLKQIGAAEERDDIFAASCYCPIHNLENADKAYEWQFYGENSFHRTKHQKSENGIIRVPYEGVMTKEQQAASKPLKDAFPAYLNSLHLTAGGKELTLDAEGKGSFKEWVMGKILASAQKESLTHDNESNRPERMTKGSFIDEQNYISYKDGKPVSFDWRDYIQKITRMKAAPAFDSLDMNSPENEEFGDEQVDARHFTAYSFEHSLNEHPLKADERIVRLMNPTIFIQEDRTDIAPHWRIRHGAFDRDTSLAVPAILALLLEDHGKDVDFFYPWGIPHAGDYDMDDLFAWIESITVE